MTPICEDGSDNDQGAVGKGWKRTGSEREELALSARLRSLLYGGSIVPRGEVRKLFRRRMVLPVHEYFIDGTPVN